MAGTESSLDAFKEVRNDKSVDTTRKMRVGIIGTGWIAGAHIKSYLNQPDVEIVAVKCYPSHKEMLDDGSLKLDAVSVCTYNRQHAAPAIYALEKGVNVLLEKPMCVTVEEAADIIRAEKKSGKVLSIGFQPRMDENMKEIKKICQSGVLGDIYYIQTGGGRRRGIPTPFGTSFIEDETAGIGALADIGCYSLDMVLNAIGYPKPLTVSGYKSAFFGTDPNYCGYPDDKKAEYAKKFGVDDFAAAFIRLEGGIILDFRIAWAMHVNTPGDTIIFGTEGALRIPSTDCWNGSVGGPMTLYHDVAGVQVDTVIPILNNTKGGLFDQKIRSFLDAIATNGPAPVPTSQILYNQAIIDGINKSNACGHEIEIKFAD